MLSEKVKVDPGTGFSVIPDDKYQCQILDVNAVEQANSFKGGKIETRLNYQFAILDEKKEDENLNSLRGRFLWRRVTPSLNQKAWLYKLASAVEGRELSQEEREKFDPESLVGKQVNVMVESKKASNGNIYANIISFSPAKKKMEELEWEPKPAEIEKSSSPATAPDEEEEEGTADDFIAELEKAQDK